MPFKAKEGEPLTERVGVRFTEKEKAKLQKLADDAGLTVSELVRRITFGRKLITDLEEMHIRHLNRLGGLLNKLYTQSGGVNAALSAKVLRRIYSAIDEQANRASIR
jgi:hypothetical protein